MDKDIVFCQYSITGNTKKIAEKLKNLFPNVDITPNLIVDKKYILITSSIDFGAVPPEVNAFLENNSGNLIAVIGSGNRNWGYNYCGAAKSIAKDYNVKYIGSIELAGTQTVIKEIKEDIKTWLKTFE